MNPNLIKSLLHLDWIENNHRSSSNVNRKHQIELYAPSSESRDTTYFINCIIRSLRKKERENKKKNTKLNESISNLKESVSQLKVELRELKEELEDAQEIVGQQLLATDCWQGRFSELADMVEAKRVDDDAISRIRSRFDNDPQGSFMEIVLLFESCQVDGEAIANIKYRSLASGS